MSERTALNELGCNLCSHHMVALLHRTKLVADRHVLLQYAVKMRRGEKVGALYTHTYTHTHILSLVGDEDQ